MNNFYFALVILFTSLVACFVPYLIHSRLFMGKPMIFISAYGVSLLLAVLLMDFIPHIVKGPCGLTVTEHQYYLSLFAGGLGFIVLLGVDCVFLNHTCNDEKTHCSDSHSHAASLETQEEAPSMCISSAIKKSKGIFESLIFTFALSLHSFLEGLAANPSNSISSYEIALIFHKILESLTLSLNLQNSSLSSTGIFIIFTFYSLLTPLGIILSALSKKNQTILAIFNGLAFGSLLFIIFVEMIPALFHTKKNGKKKLLLLVTGFTINSLVIIYSHKNHSHHHH